MIKKSQIIWSKSNSKSYNYKPVLFKGLSEDSLQKILDCSFLQKYASGKSLVDQGDDPIYVYLIVRGGLRTLRSNLDGEEVTMSMYRSGEVCMESAVFLGLPSPVSVYTTEKTELMLIPSDFVRKFILQDSRFASNLLTIMSHHYNGAIHQIDAISIKTPVQRVGYYFLQKHMEQGADSMEFELPFKKSVIANHLGMTPETFSRALGQIKKMGIEVDGEKIRMKDAYSLCHFCDLDMAHECTVSGKGNCHNCLRVQGKYQ